MSLAVHMNKRCAFAIFVGECAFRHLQESSKEPVTFAATMPKLVTELVVVVVVVDLWYYGNRRHRCL